MRSLIVEDEFTSRMQLKFFLNEYGECDIALNGFEAIKAYVEAIERNRPYDLICLDIQLPGKDGNRVLKEIREFEKRMEKAPSDHVKIFMTTARNDLRTINDALTSICDEYLLKPIDKLTLVEKLTKHKLIDPKGQSQNP